RHDPRPPDRKDERLVRPPLGGGSEEGQRQPYEEEPAPGQWRAWGSRVFQRGPPERFGRKEPLTVRAVAGEILRVMTGQPDEGAQTAGPVREPVSVPSNERETCVKYRAIAVDTGRYRAARSRDAGC